jgi:predicted DNA binding protein
MELGDGLTMLEVHIQSPQGGSCAEEVRALPGVEALEVIDATEGSEVLRVSFRGKTFLPLIKQLKLLRHFPFPIQDGVATWTVVGPEGKVRELLKKLETEAAGVKVEAVHHGPLPRGSPLLTPRQQEILHRAMIEGYFDVPRRISLTELAQRMGVAISTLSVTLAVIEKKIVEGHA